jgi:uncharacterized cupin superfamily protein
MQSNRTCAALALAAASATLSMCALASDANQPPVEVPHGNPSSFKWIELPEFGGKEAIIYRSADGTRVAAAFHESGSATFTYPFDEFLVVTSGSVTIKVHGGSTFTLTTGDVAYLREGMTVDFSFSHDFSDITFLVSDHEVKWR